MKYFKKIYIYDIKKYHQGLSFQFFSQCCISFAVYPSISVFVRLPPKKTFWLFGNFLIVSLCKVTTWETGQSLGKTAVEKFWGVRVGKGQGEGAH